MPAPVGETPVVEKPVAATAVEPGLRVQVSPIDAELVIDGRNYGKMSELRFREGVLPLRAGLYRVSLQHPGYSTWRAEVSVGDQVEELKVELVKR